MQREEGGGKDKGERSQNEKEGRKEKAVKQGEGNEDTVLC